MQACAIKIIAVISSLMLFACGGGGSGGGRSSGAAVSSVSSSNLSSVASSAAQDFGIATRPTNKTCFATGTSFSESTAISWTAAFPSLPNIRFATSLVQAPGDDSVWYVLQQSGVVRRFANEASAAQLDTVLNIEDRVDFKDSETGLLGIAFHPQFSTNRYVYLYYMGRSSVTDWSRASPVFNLTGAEISTAAAN